MELPGAFKRKDEFKFDTSLFENKAPLYPSLKSSSSAKDKGLSFNFGSDVKKSVWEELNARAEQVERNQKAQKQAAVATPKPNRFASAHSAKFSKMDSITSHYAASRKREAAQQESAPKRRRTTTGMSVVKPESPRRMPMSPRRTTVLSPHRTAVVPLRNQVNRQTVRTTRSSTRSDPKRPWR